MNKLFLTLVLILMLAGCSRRTIEPMQVDDLPNRSVADSRSAANPPAQDVHINRSMRPRMTETPAAGNTPVNNAPVDGNASVNNTPMTGNVSVNNVPVSNNSMKTVEKPSNQLAHHETQFDATDSNRGTNIALATGSINNAIIRPGETFSFNDTIGSTVEERGYKESIVYVGGKKSKSFGGGVCQVSTTLCNAAINAGMTIVERHDHSLPVKYAEEGSEAATSHSGNLDFKFKNEKPHPVTIQASSNNGTISVSINAVHS